MPIFCFRKGPRTEWDRHRGRPEKPGVEEGEASASCGELLGVGQVAGNRLQEWRRGDYPGAEVAGTIWAAPPLVPVGGSCGETNCVSV